MCHLQLAGHMLDENQEEIFQKVKQMATDPNMDRYRIHEFGFG